MITTFVIEVLAALLFAVLTVRLARTFPPSHAEAARCLALLITVLLLLGSTVVVLLF